MIYDNATGLSNKAIVTATPTILTTTTFTLAVAYYEAAGQAFAVSSTCSVWSLRIAILFPV